MNAEKIFNTERTFQDLGVPDDLCQALAAHQVVHPTPIQEQSLPTTLSGQDLVGKAETGTGKTFCFGIPMIDKVDPVRSSIQALILTPTRELAQQIVENLSLIAPTRNIQIGCAIGGERIQGQSQAIRGSQILVATPGRVLDLCERNNITLGWCHMVALDEFDRMLDMGFIDDVKKILGLLPRQDRHTMLFSATAPPQAKTLISKFMKKPAWVETARGTQTAKTIRQETLRIPAKKKYRKLLSLLDRFQGESCLIFCNTRKDVRFLDRELFGRGYPAGSLSSDHDQQVRFSVLEAFRRKEFSIIVATDVASRGLDIDHIEHVINYTVPDDVEEYVHRIGRTGRIGREGHVLTFVSPEEEFNFRKIIEHVGVESIEGADDLIANPSSDTHDHKKKKSAPKKHRRSRPKKRK